MKKNMRNPFVLVVSIVLSTLILTGCGGGGATAINDRAFAVAMQSDGKIVAAGDSYNDNNGWSFALVRYNSNGSLDTTFGTGGKVLTNIGAGIRDIVIQGDGKIVAAGYSYVSPNNFVLVRYNSNGSLDTNFGSGGMVLTTLGGGVSALAVQATDGKIVAAGYSFNGIGNDFALARYNTNGTIDTTFGFGGTVITASGGMGGGASDVAIQSGGNILAAGGSYLIRYNSNGMLDITFNPVSGMVYTGPAYEQTSVVTQADGKILAAGSINNVGAYNLALTRYNSIDGFPDFSFDTDGTAITIAFSPYKWGATSVVPLGSNIVVAGYSPYQFVLARYTSTGFPDTTFATGGALLATGGSYWSNDSVVRNIAVQTTDGKIVLVGSSYKDDASGYDFALARLNSDGSLDTGFGTGGKVTTGM